MHALPSPFACRALLVAVFSAIPAHAQSVTVATLDIGGPGALGSEGGDPPVLSEGSVATGTVSYVYDSSAGWLEVTVENTTPQVADVINPVVTEVYFNLPALAVTGARLVDHPHACGVRGHRGRPRGHGRPGRQGRFGDDLWQVEFDFDTLSRPDRVREDTFGCFNVRLRTRAGTGGGIANPDATVLPEDCEDLLIGPVTFTFELEGPNLDSLTATTFATTPSVPCRRGQDPALAALHFRSGAGSYSWSPASSRSKRHGRRCRHGDRHDEERGTIGTQAGCIPGLWFAGGTCPGDTITFLRASAPGCHGCLVWSFDPTPTVIAGISVPLSPPYNVVAPEIARSSIDTLVAMIPGYRADLIGRTAYFVFAVSDPLRGPVFSEVVPVTVLCK